MLVTSPFFHSKYSHGLLWYREEPWASVKTGILALLHLPRNELRITRGINPTSPPYSVPLKHQLSSWCFSFWRGGVSGIRKRVNLQHIPLPIVAHNYIQTRKTALRSGMEWLTRKKVQTLHLATARQLLNTAGSMNWGPITSFTREGNGLWQSH